MRPPRGMRLYITRSSPDLRTRRYPVPASGPAVMKSDITEQGTVTAKAEMPARIGAETPVLILAHGANNDLDHPLLVSVTRGATEAGAIAVRFNFPYMERGAGSPDSA